jgi:hypothetical protein
MAVGSTSGDSNTHLNTGGQTPATLSHLGELLRLESGSTARSAQSIRKWLPRK